MPKLFQLNQINNVKQIKIRVSSFNKTILLELRIRNVDNVIKIDLNILYIYIYYDPPHQ